MKLFQAWAQDEEVGGGAAAAAARASRTASRHVMDAAHRYRSAVSRGDTDAIAQAQSAFRQAWESDIRRRGGKPEDFIPNLPGTDVVPYTYPGYPGVPQFFGDAKSCQTWRCALAQAATVVVCLGGYWYFKDKGSDWILKMLRIGKKK